MEENLESEDEQDDFINRNTRLGFVDRKEKVETENGEDEIPPKANDFMNQLMSFMSEELK